MKLRISYSRAASPVDLEVEVEGAATIGDLARTLVRLDPMRPYDPMSPSTLAVAREGAAVALPADVLVGDSGLASGAVVSVVAPGAVERPREDSSAAVLRVLEGPDQGRKFPLRTGTNYLGRNADMDVRLTDPLVSKSHAKVNVGATIEIIDNGSANGVELEGITVGRAVLQPSDRVTLGDTVIEVIGAVRAPGARTTPEDHSFVRPPRVVPRFDDEAHPSPEPPGAVRSQRFPLIALVTPVVIGAVLYLVTGSILSLLFVALSPFMMIGQWAESRWSGRRAHREEVAAFRDSLVEMVALVRTRQDVERDHRLREHPATADVVAAVGSRADLLWCRRPDSPGFLEVRLGLGSSASRVTVEANGTRQGNRELHEEAAHAAAAVREIDGVPIVAALRQCGSLGVAGEGEPGAGVARALVLQLAGLHSPAELVIAACVGSVSSDRWNWLTWLPHTDGSHAPIDTDLLASGLVGSSVLIAALEAVVATRTDSAGGPGAPAPIPAVVLVVEDDAVVDRPRLVALAERGLTAGVHVIWVAPTRSRLPAACRAFVSVSRDGAGIAGFPEQAQAVEPLTPETLMLPTVTAAARSMSPLVDAGATLDTSSDLPRSVSYLSLAGTGLAENAAEVVDRWVETDSLAAHRAPGRRRAHGSLRALVGQGASESLYLDLRTQGPHALVGGTTGSGKSELLQSWVLGMAAAHSPERVTFLFVDYKGGAAFGECVRLPHSVGLVTDLSPHLVRRALVSLSAELRHREHILNSAKAKDLAEMERSGHPETPPSLVIVVDEFAALAQDVPEFVDGVVNVAQRGRSLGLHLILATQRPAGVIKDNLRANTNLRLALRMADADDSSDILGTDLAAGFDPSIPGRAAVRSGPGSLVTFQSAYVGGWTSGAPTGPEVTVRELSLGGSARWVDPDPDIVTFDGPTDLQRLVSSITAAAVIASVAPPRRPWLPELPSVVDLTALPTGRQDSQLVFGLADHPGSQDQPPVSFDPDRDGNLVVVGTGGSGKSAALRALAVAAGFTVRGGPVQVYGLDFGSRGLQMLDALPHVGSIVSGDDAERVLRLMRWLRLVIDERAQRYSAVQASSISDYRANASMPDEARILLLLDGFAAFRQAYDVGATGSILESLTAIASEGRQVGVHVIMTADRMATIPSSLASMVPRRLVLRVADENELSILGVPRDLFTQESPAGRGWLAGVEVQVGVLGGSASLVTQARAVERLADAIRRNTSWPPAGPIGRLPEAVDLRSLPVLAGGTATLGLEDESLAPVGIPGDGTFIVAGPPGSGRTSTVAAIVRSVRRSDAGVRAVLVTPTRSPLLGRVEWHRVASGVDDVASICEEVQQLASDVGNRIVLVVESPADFLNSAADLPLQDLVKTVRLNGHLVVAEGDTQSMAGSWPLLQALRFSRRGIVLQPDQTDGDLLLRTSFPRIRRADFPCGRGLLVREGRVMKVQVAQV